LERVEALLVAAGVLHESDIGQDAISEDEDEEDDEDKNEQWDDRPISSGRVSNLSQGSEIARFSSGGDFALTPLFKSHGSDDSRYFGLCSALSCSYDFLYATNIIHQDAAVHSRSYHGVVSSGSRTKLGTLVS
jgi:hypothetical protein